MLCVLRTPASPAERLNRSSRQIRIGPKKPIQEAQLSPRDRAMPRVNWNLANCHATVQKLLIRQVLTKSMVWSWRFSRRQCVIDNVHSIMTRSSRLPLSQVSVGSRFQFLRPYAAKLRWPVDVRVQGTRSPGDCRVRRQTHGHGTYRASKASRDKNCKTHKPWNQSAAHVN